MDVKEAGLARCVLVHERLACAQDCQDGIVKSPGAVDVIGSDHDVAEHVVISLAVDLQDAA